MPDKRRNDSGRWESSGRGKGENWTFGLLKLRYLTARRLILRFDPLRSYQ